MPGPGGRIGGIVQNFPHFSQEILLKRALSTLQGPDFRLEFTE
jgi:hypothetical protein